MSEVSRFWCVMAHSHQHEGTFHRADWLVMCCIVSHPHSQRLWLSGAACGAAQNGAFFFLFNHAFIKMWWNSSVLKWLTSAPHGDFLWFEFWSLCFEPVCVNQREASLSDHSVIAVTNNDTIQHECCEHFDYFITSEAMLAWEILTLHVHPFWNNWLSHDVAKLFPLT